MASSDSLEGISQVHGLRVGSLFIKGNSTFLSCDCNIKRCHVTVKINVEITYYYIVESAIVP